MITLKQESILLKKLKQLSELEMEAILKELYEHLLKNRQAHLFTECGAPDLREELDHLESEFDELSDKYSDAKSYAQHAVEILEDIENIDDDVQKDIDKTISLLNNIDR